MENIHSLLSRQISKHLNGNTEFPPAIQNLLKSINETYHHFEVDRKMMERSLELSSQELLQKNSEVHAIFKAFPDIFFRTELDGNIVDYKISTKDFYIKDSNLFGKKIH